MKYVLYKKDTCPYCIKVMNYINESGRDDIEFKDVIKDPANKDYLIENGGKYQVPCLFIDGKAMYESDDIIDYLSKTD